MFYLGCHRSELSLFFYRYSKYIRAVSLLVIYIFLCFVLYVRPLLTNVKDIRRECHFSAAASKKSQHRLTFGCQLQEDTNYSGSYLKAEMSFVASCPFIGPVDRRLCLPSPDCGQQGVWGGVIVMPQVIFGVIAAKDNYILSNCVARL